MNKLLYFMVKFSLIHDTKFVHVISKLIVKRSFCIMGTFDMMDFQGILRAEAPRSLR